MLTTRQVLAALREANPDAIVTEDRLRNVLRRGEVPPPGVFAGRLSWTRAEAEQVARALGLSPPSPRVLAREESRPATRG